MSALALATMPQTPDIDPQWHSRSPDRVNPLQKLLADAMADAGMPLDRRGSKAELSRRSGVSETIIGFILNRPRYVPDEAQRVKLCRALGIPRERMDTAAAKIKGLRVYTNPSPSDAPPSPQDVVQRLDADVSDFLLALDEMSDAERDEAVARIDELAAEIRRRTEGNG